MSSFDLFETIWTKTVLPTCTDYLSKYEFIDYVEKSKKIAKRWFEKESLIFEQSYMIDTTKNIDRHKIASCMTKAILIAKPLRISFWDKINQFFSHTKFDDTVYLINQIIAINVAVLILEGYIRSDDTKKIKHKIRFPDPFPKGDNDYVKDVCLDLYYMNPKKFNTISYADIFFLWEKYSCRRAHCNNLIRYIKKVCPNITDQEIENISLKSEEDFVAQHKG